MKRQTKKSIFAGGKKTLAVMAAGALAASMMPTTAFASSLQEAKEAMSAEGAVIGCAFAAAEPTPDFLGLNNPEERSASKATDMKLTIFGTDINENPDPYFWNTYQNLNEGTSYSPSILLGQRQGSPMSVRKAYQGDNCTSDQIWDMLPDIIIGTGSDVAPDNERDFYNTDEYARAVETANGLDANSYNPIGVTYNRVNLNTMIATMYRVAVAADEVVAKTGKTLRYGSATEIAKDYERYITGAKGAVLKAINSGQVEKKTIASVTSYADGVYKIQTEGVAEGTATTNRLLEAVQGVTTNYYDLSTATVNDDTTKDATAEELAQCDLIIFGGQNTSGDVTGALTNDGLISKTFYATNMSSGSIFGTTVNSTENCVNIGRVLPCAYPEVLDQSDMVAYYFDNIYHLKTEAVAPTIDQYMDGVRNWAATDTEGYLVWSESDIAGYNSDDVEAILQSGIDYLNALTNAGVDYPAVMQPTEYLADSTAGVAYRLSGETRYDTMASVVSAGFDSAETAIVASGDNFPDALSASALAGAYDAPVVLTTKDALGDQAKAELEALDVKNVIIVGGTAAVSDAAASAISGMGITVDRISGDTRQATAREVAKAVTTKTGTAASTYVVATGKNFADALAIAPYAYANRCPILLCDNDGNLDADSAALITSGAQVVICGGDAVVSTATEQMFANSKRLAGSTRYDTANEIVKYELENGMNTTSSAVATGENFPDALAGAALVGSKGGVLVLAKAADSPAVSQLTANTGKIAQLYFLGGTNAISDEIATTITSNLNIKF